MLITGSRRGCPVSSCDKYESGERARQLAKSHFWLCGMRTSDQEMLDLYEQGLSDVEIAVVIKKSRILVSRWRRKMGLPSQKQIEVSARDD